MTAETAAPPQGQSINLQQQASAEVHMQQLQGELVGADFRAGWNSLADPRHIDRNEDSQYANVLPDGTQVFGVFDGVGGHDAGDRASRTAMQELHDQVGRLSGADKAEKIENIFDSVARKVDALGKGGSTGTVVAIETMPDGKKILHYGAVGDSLAFVVKADGRVIQLNTEESLRQQILDNHKIKLKRGDKTALNTEYADVVAVADKKGHVITNMLGEGNYAGLEQQGKLEVEDGDQVLLTSDGITGDKEIQRLSGGQNNEAVISEIMTRKDLTPKQKAEELIKRATKIDDRSAMVVEILSKNTKTPETEQVLSFAQQLGLVDRGFRVYQPEGQMHEGGWTVAGRGTLTVNGEKVPAVKLTTLEYDASGKPVMELSFATTVSELQRWQQVRVEEQRNAALRQQNEMGATARAAIAGIHNSSDDIDPNGIPRPVIDSVPVTKEDFLLLEQRNVAEHNSPFEARIKEIDDLINRLTSGLGEADVTRLWSFASNMMSKREAQEQGNGDNSYYYEGLAGQSYRAMSSEAQGVSGQYLRLVQQKDALYARMK